MILSSSANGAECNSLGRRPRIQPAGNMLALQARNKVDYESLSADCAPSALKKCALTITQAVGLGFNISRPWRLGTVKDFFGQCP
jgi:hypothetical protein